MAQTLNLAWNWCHSSVLHIKAVALPMSHLMGRFPFPSAFIFQTTICACVLPSTQCFVYLCSAYFQHANVVCVLYIYRSFVAVCVLCMLAHQERHACPACTMNRRWRFRWSYRIRTRPKAQNVQLLCNVVVEITRINTVVHGLEMWFFFSLFISNAPTQFRDIHSRMPNMACVALATENRLVLFLCVCLCVKWTTRQWNTWSHAEFLHTIGQPPKHTRQLTLTQLQIWHHRNAATICDPWWNA